MDATPDLLTAISQMQTTSYLNLAAVIVVLYDASTCFANEWECIWRRKWSFPKIFYLCCRYYGIFVVIVNFLAYSRVQSSHLICNMFLSFLILGGSVPLTIATDMIAVMRLYALYNRSKTFLIAISCFYTMHAVGLLVAAAFLVEHVLRAGAILPLEGIFPGCHILPRPYVNMVTTLEWSIVLVFSSALFFLMMVKYFELLSRLRGPDDWCRRDGLRLTPMLKAFYSSGAVWYFTLTLAICFNAIAYYCFPGPLKPTGIPWFTVAQSISGSRLVLDIRDKTEPDPLQSKVSGRHQPIAFRPATVMSQQSEYSGTPEP